MTMRLLSQILILAVRLNTTDWYETVGATHRLTPTQGSSTSWLLACALALRASILPIESRFRTMTLKMHRHRPL